MINMDPLTIATIITLGFVVGFIVGLTSVGSGALMTPILLLDFSGIVGKAFIVGTSSTYGTVSKAFGSIQNYMSGKFRSGYMFIIATTGVPLAVVGAFYSSALISWNFFSPIIAVLLIVVASVILIQSRFEKFSGRDPKIDGKLRIKGAIIGIIVGLIAGFTGVSTGSLLVACLIIIMKFPNHSAVNIAILEGGLILLAATLTQIFLGHVNYLFTGILLIGGIPGILIGGRFKYRFDQKKLGYLIAAVIIFESARTLSSFFLGKSFFFF